jgi:hypothetical protein
MGLLINRFCYTIHEWSRRTGQSEMTVLVRIMTDTGGVWHYQPTGKVEASHLSRGLQHSLTVDDLEGYYSVKQLKGWIETLVEKVGMREEFLVPAITRSVEDELADLADDRGVGNTRQRFRRELDATTAAPVYLREFVDQLNRPSMIDALLRHPAPLSDADVQATREVWAMQNQPLDDDVRTWSTALEVRRELTAPLRAFVKPRTE